MKSYCIDKNTLSYVSDDFQKELDKNDAARLLTLANSKFLRPTGQEHGNFIALDFGGSNIRINFIELFGNGSSSVDNVFSFQLSDLLNDSSTENLYDLFYSIATLLKNKILSNKIYALGHTFSFPCEHLSCNSAILKKWTKELFLAGAIGQDINSILLKALLDCCVKNVVPTAILNDTVSTLLAASYSKKNVTIGSICGTGHNSAFFNNSGCAINIESGNFDSKSLREIQNDFDKQLAAELITEGQVFEKMVSGAYLARIFNFAADSYSKNHSGFNYTAKTTKDISDFSESKNPDHTKVKELASCILKRAARLVAASFHAIILHVDPTIIEDHVIAIDGSLYTKCAVFADCLQEAIIELFGEKHAKITVESCSDGSSIGAAVAAALAK